MFVVEKQTLIYKYDICPVNWRYPAKTRNMVSKLGIDGCYVES